LQIGVSPYGLLGHQHDSGPGLVFLDGERILCPADGNGSRKPRPIMGRM